MQEFETTDQPAGARKAAAQEGAKAAAADVDTAEATERTEATKAEDASAAVGEAPAEAEPERAAEDLALADVAAEAVLTGVVDAELNDQSAATFLAWEKQ
ncbi:uncharacterized protein IL334_006905 [Kwoniella shivajii]|uniref:Uncharacterized protein n=1 Tax=Kwoniella shivajii TaxID=564305 RepID=A0ABZ1D912_9TREE|nr:hypothetical protein IL334_006905 [Kwoniella shivajii]